MTVGELKQLLGGVSDSTPVVVRGGRDDGFHLYLAKADVLEDERYLRQGSGLVLGEGATVLLVESDIYRRGAY